MKNRFFALLSTLVLALPALGCSKTGGLTEEMASPDTLHPTPVSGYTFDLPADQGWSDTGIRVRAGQAVRFAYLSGLISDARQAIPDAGGTGYVCGREGCCEPLPTAPRGALVGRVRGEVFYIGNGGLLEMPAAGTLQLRINDCDDGLYDNRGSLCILVLLEHE